MLGIEWPRMLKGQIQLECTGIRLVAFINATVQEGILVENIYWVDEHKLQLTVMLPDFFRLVRLMREYQVRMRIRRKAGVPFIVERMKRRKSFFMGFILFFFLLFLMSSFVWKVQIEGTEHIPAHYVRALLQKEGVYLGQLKMRLPDRELVQHRLLSQLPQASWIGLRVEGTRVIITVVEKKRPDPTETDSASPGPVHLIAKKNSLIVDMQVERGNPQVEVNDVVKEGQILVSGIYGDPYQPETGKVVGAKGKVMGEVWFESEISIPITQKRKVYTGVREKVTFPFVTHYILRNPFGSDLPYKQYEVIQHVQALQFGKWQLPVGWVEEEYLEMEWIHHKLTPEEALDLGIKQARAELLQKLGPDGRILEEKVLHQRVENGKVYLKVHFDAVENIAVPQPILQGE